MTGKKPKMKQQRMMTASLLASVAHIAAYDPGTAPTWKMDGDNIATRDGNPLYIASDGSEMVIEFGTISRLNGEAKQHRTAKEAAEAKLRNYEGLDPVKAREAIETMSKIEAKKLIDAGEVDKVRDQISTAFQAQIGEKDKAIGTLQGRLNGLILDAAFNGSAFIRDNIAVPADLFRDGFSKFFKVENEKVTPIGRDGNPLYSKQRAGELADFDEAVAMLVDTHPAKDQLLKLNTGGGTGNGGGGSGRGNAPRTMRRVDFDKLPGHQQAEYAALMRKGEIQIRD